MPCILLFTIVPDAWCAVQGYDMEDAMVLNKASVERGFAHGSIYKGRVCIMYCSAMCLIIMAIILLFTLFY